MFLGPMGLEYVVHDDVMLITSRDAAERIDMTRTYPVQDLLGGRNGSESLLKVVTLELEAHATRGKGKIVFLIGGADGLPSEVLARSAEKLSLSAMTLPHRLARLVLAEQLYRAVTILRGEPYARL